MEDERCPHSKGPAITPERLGDFRRRFDEIQARDGLPCPDTGISHCRDCHGAVHSVAEYLDGPGCGHTAGCPEC
jgi:hypothetical protein